VRARARRQKSEHPELGLVIVDYLQKVHAKSESREREIAVISSQLKSLAKELEIPVICLAQLNRRPEGREGNQPQLSDLRESGAIEQDADVVMLLYREDYYNRETDQKNTCDVIAKNWPDGPGEARLHQGVHAVREPRGPTTGRVSWPDAALVHLVEGGSILRERHPRDDAAREQARRHQPRPGIPRLSRPR
jgi:hypothetical protein